ncbi:MAG: hypothetical protein P4N24_12095 [Acidobacteriota bacterium]|nr:hypothetical protein [Acidobacteriota bacterium]
MDGNEQGKRRAIEPGGRHEHQPVCGLAVAEKVSALRTTLYFEDAKARADYQTFDKIMRRRREKPPCKEDEMPGGK